MCEIRTHVKEERDASHRCSFPRHPIPPGGVSLRLRGSWECVSMVLLPGLVGLVAIPTCATKHLGQNKGRGTG